MTVDKKHSGVHDGGYCVTDGAAKGAHVPEIPSFVTLETEEPARGRHLSLALGSYAGVPTAALFVGDSHEPILLPMAYLVDAICRAAICEHKGCISQSIGSFSVEGNEEMLLCETHAEELLADLFPGEVSRWIVDRDGTLRSEIDVSGF